MVMKIMFIHYSDSFVLSLIVTLLVSVFVAVAYGTQESLVLPVPSEHIDANEFIHSHGLYNKFTTFVKSTNATTLAYVTPWNKKGYEIAEWFALKLSMVSPVWFRITGRKKVYTVTGVPDIDQEWINRIKTVNLEIKIVPRITFEEWNDEDFIETLQDKSKSRQCIESIIKILKFHNFDGAVIEIWSQFSGLGLHQLSMFVSDLADQMHLNHLLIILVIPPPVYAGGYEGRFTRQYLDRLQDHIDYFSLMTYDYSSPIRHGPNSPIEWVEECVKRLVPDGSSSWQNKRAKLLTGFNFYGVDYIPKRQAATPVLGPEFVEKIKSFQPTFMWDVKWAEHSVTFKDDTGEEHVIFYPSLMSIARRLHLVSHLGTGISIWEIGQGLDSFYSLL